jgi:uncharacterized membrane protein HdeD (DUF308 family)
MATRASTYDLYFSNDLARHWGWLLALGLVQLCGGMFSLALPVVASIFAAALVGWLLLFSAVAHIIHAFKVRAWRGFALHLLGALAFGAAGVLIVFDPLRGAISLTLVIAWLFLADSVIRSILAVRLRPHDGWGWFLASAIMSFVVGLLLLLGWPATGFWTLGTLLGIDLIFSGVSYIFLSVAARRKTRSPEFTAAAHPV